MKQVNLKKVSLSLITATVMGLGLVNCGGSSTAATDTTNSYTGAGSQWDNTINETAKTFAITHRPEAGQAIDFTINGTFETLTSGFKKLTVTTATGTDAPTVGSTGYGLDIPGYAFFLQPSDSSGELITMVAGGECPTEDVTGNWITVKNLHDVNTTTNLGTPQDVSSATADSFGTFSWNATTNQLELPANYALVNPTTSLGGQAPFDVNCTDGVATITDVTMYLTSNGGLIVHAEHDSGSGNGTTDESVINAFAAETLTATSDFDGTYAGILLSADASTSSSVKPVSLTCLAGSCTGLIIDPDTNVAPLSGGGTATLNLTSAVNSPSAGFVSGTMTTPDGTGNMTCMVDTAAAGTTKTLINCSGQNPGATTELFNMILVSQ
jgi:hypothetical protein